MDELLGKLANIPKVGTAKIAGFVCNKKAPVVLRLDLEIPAEKLENALAVLNLEPSKELIDSLEVALRGLKKTKG